MCILMTFATILLSLMIISSFPMHVFAGTSSVPTDNWPMFLNDPAHTGYSNSSGPASPAVRDTFTNIGNVGSSPAVVDDSIYVASSYGNLYSISATTGAQNWVNFKIQGMVQSSPAVANGNVYVGCDDGRVYCIDAQTGSQIWNYTTRGWIRSSPTVVGGYVYVGSSDGNVYCLDASKGTKLWNYTTGTMSPNAGTTTIFTSGMSSPAVTDGYVFVGGPSLYCLSASSGKQVWGYPISVPSAPSVSAGNVYAIADDGNAYCLDAATGNKIWNYTVQPPGLGVSSSAVAHGYLYVGGDGVYCLNASTGAKTWSTMKGLVDPYTFGSPAVAGNSVYISATAGGPDQYTYCLDCYNGEVIWKSTVVGNGSPPAVADGILYVGGFGVAAIGPSTWSLVFPLLAMEIIAVVGIVGVVSFAVLFLVYMTKLKQLPSYSSLQRRRLKRRFSLFMALILIVLVSGASLVALYESGLPATSFPTPVSNLPSHLWQVDIGHQVTDAAFDNGKVFVIDNFGAMFAFDAQTGESFWNTSVGGYGGNTIETYEGYLYVSSASSLVKKLDESTGKLELQFKAPAEPDQEARAIPSFFVADGRVFASFSGIAVYNATTGELFWRSSYTEGLVLGNASAFAPPSSFVYIDSMSRINPNNGSVMWHIPGFSETALVLEDRVVFWNYNGNGTYGETGHTILCVNASSSGVLWNFDAGTSVFEPTFYNDLLLFGASDGNLYALHLADGTLAWKTRVDTEEIMSGKNLPAESKYYSEPAVSPVLVDSQTNTVTWAFAVTQSGVNGIEGNDLYVGVLCSLDLSSGHTVWNSQIVRNGSVSTGLSYTPILSLVSVGPKLYLSAAKDLWALNLSTGFVQGMRHFDFGSPSLVTGYSELFVTEDVYIMRAL
jgi:outer membrane protein assembly factor BamB